MSGSHPRLALRTTTTLAVAVAGLSVAGIAAANTPGPGLVINEAYGGGGNSGAAFDHDFVELRNTGSSTVSLGGLSVQYRPASPSASTVPSVFALPSVDVPPGQTFLISGAAGTSGGPALPAADATSTLNLAGAGGQVYLANSTSAIDPGTGAISNPAVIDFVGWGSATSYETAKAPATTNASSVTRDAAGTDTNNNATDFTVANPPTPAACGTACGATPPPPPTEHTIAEIQGTGDVSPLKGQNVTTEGVVTAAYPTGGFFGYVIQTDGTGAGTDATPGASDAVFVHQPAGAVAVQTGQYVEVTGSVSEFAGLTELNVAASDVTDLGTPPLGGVTPLETAYPTTDADREAHESELIAPTNQLTVTDNYSTNQYGEIGLATGDHQLVQPTDVYPASDTADIARVQADNDARLVTLNDGSTWNYLTTDKNTPMPWLDPTHPVRIGSTATLHQPVILDYRNGLWELQPTGQVRDLGAAVATFSDTRAQNQAPAAVGGDLKLATFNVENFFPTSAADYQAMDPANTCTSYNDRTGTPITVRQCDPNGPRGAWDATNLQRQLAKEVRAINTMNADVVSLEEIENSVQFGKNRDDALAQLVAALNADAGTTRWAFVPSPANLPPTTEQDVIRTAFIYNPAKVTPVGASVVLSNESDPGQSFANAREPLAQEFKRKGALDSDGFLVIVNHLKSKGDSNPPATGDNAAGLQGAFNGDRIRQAQALVDFAQQVATDRGTDKVFLVGDFNSYTREDPMQVLYDAGYVNQASDDPKDVSYEFGGLAGSLDHVLASPAAVGMVTGKDVWQINAEESVGFEYSRYNYNATLLYQPDQFRASDHNPEVVGLAAPYSQQDATVTATATPDRIKKKKDTSTVTATVSAPQATPTGTVEFVVSGTVVCRTALTGGTASCVVGPFTTAGTRTVQVRYLGDTVTRPGSTSVDVTVTNGNPEQD